MNPLWQLGLNVVPPVVSVMSICVVIMIWYRSEAFPGRLVVEALLGASIGNAVGIVFGQPLVLALTDRTDEPAIVYFSGALLGLATGLGWCQRRQYEFENRRPDRCLNALAKATTATFAGVMWSYVGVLLLLVWWWAVTSVVEGARPVGFVTVPPSAWIGAAACMGFVAGAIRQARVMDEISRRRGWA